MGSDQKVLGAPRTTSRSHFTLFDPERNNISVEMTDEPCHALQPDDFSMNSDSVSIAPIVHKGLGVNSVRFYSEFERSYIHHGYYW
jgi:hypothetical protein